MVGKAKVIFETLLLDHIEFGQNAKVISILKLNPDLVRKHDDFGTLLHYAAMRGNAEIARHLISLGSKVNQSGQLGRTPLMWAVASNSIASARVLIEANANVDIVSGAAESASRIAFRQEHVDEQIFRLFFDRVRNEAASLDEAIDKLLSYGCTLYQVAFFLGDVRILARMLKRGIDVNSRFYRRTALHAAVDMNNVRLAKWLLTWGADVDALDKHGCSALYSAATRQNKELVQLLLEHGAKPNDEYFRDGETILFRVVACIYVTASRVNECVELLLQHGAVPRTSRNSRNTIYDWALRSGDRDRPRFLIAQLALLEKIGNSVTEPVTAPNNGGYREDLAELGIFHEQCKQTLEIEMFGNSSLLDLLAASEFKMRRYARNESFVSQIEENCEKHELSRVCSYYCRTLMKRVNDAVSAIRLENQVFSILCRVFDANENECYIAAKIIIGYLRKYELERFCEAINGIPDENSDDVQQI